MFLIFVCICPFLSQPLNISKREKKKTEKKKRESNESGGCWEKQKETE
jgi:hypothetical protein